VTYNHTIILAYYVPDLCEALPVWIVTGLGDLDLTSINSSISLTRDLLDRGVIERGVGERMERSGCLEDDPPPRGVLGITS